MSEQLSLKNPLQDQHLTLLRVRRVIAEKLENSKIEVVNLGLKQDYFVVSAQITVGETKGSVCYGQCMAGEFPLLDMLTAEIIAIVFAANEHGIDFSFDGAPKKVQAAEITPVRNVTKFDRNTIKKCKDIDEVKYKMKVHGLDIKMLDEYAKSLQIKKQRLTVGKAADFLFPKGSAAVFVETQEPQAKIAKDKPVAPPEPEPQRQYQRTGGEAQELLKRLSDANITVDTLIEKGSEFRNMTAFAMYATEDQVKEIFGARND